MKDMGIDVLYDEMKVATLALQIIIKLRNLIQWRLPT